ncbi:Sporulation related domain-containing protein [Sphingomonas sp. OV641]|uniref:SPOR domain-containing protein n=1 Tax=Sphingomonas sp. OV641 TaxID=1881068 RepID=UPI0008D078F4|nr:SPOR domain-containing protein [Sphingomonas sp. OV641]SEJ28509.1 Sporulation related domain-containing protein [Sphingomonas sp. OV641]
MLIARPLILAAALVGAPGAFAQSYPGQQAPMVPRPTPDADALAGAMRRLGANPRDLAALIEAAELSLKLGDVNAAASLLKRAENVDPMNGRVKAGMARILVTQERPGEALRYFDQAVGYGLDPRTFAGDRGLAYDLIGEQERAQRDYRVALRSGGTEEVQRRYALSLGISGKQKEALEIIDDQVRGNDRSAWRVRAFVLAMTGDVPGAQKIAGTMMPQGMGAALAPFFTRLATLPAADRAFAVHFGELRPTPQRLADARMVPALPPLAPEPDRPVQTAAVATPSAPPPAADRGSARSEASRRREAARAEQRARRAGRSDTRTAAAVTAPVVPQPPVATAVGQPPMATAVRQPVNEPTAFQPPRYAGVAFAPPRAVVQSVPGAADDTANRTGGAASVSTASTPSASSRVGTPLPSAGLAQSRAQDRMATPAGDTLAAVRESTNPPAPTVASSTPAAAVPLSAAQATGSAPAASIVAATAPSVESVVPSSANPSVAPRTEVVTSSPTARTGSSGPALTEDTILARIMAGISIPGAELGVAPIRQPEPMTRPSAADVPSPGGTVATASSIAAAETARKAAEAERLAQQERAEEATRARRASSTETVAAQNKPEPKAGGTKLASNAARDSKSGSEQERSSVDPKRKAADAKAAAAKKQADEKRAAEAKKAAEAAKAAKADPSRIWVQVAGGANKEDLPKAWAAAQEKAPALKGKAAYTTPLRFTNRLVTGPFKTDGEAREFINTLSKQGVSAFSFTSESGQKMVRLPAK